MKQLISIQQKGTSCLVLLLKVISCWVLLQKGISCWLILEPITVVGSPSRRIPQLFGHPEEGYQLLDHPVADTSPGPAETCARIYRPSFRENKPKALVFT
jgi:hypothetical protein